MTEVYYMVVPFLAKLKQNRAKGYLKLCIRESNSAEFIEKCGPIT